MQGLVESVSDIDHQNHDIFIVLPWLQNKTEDIHLLRDVLKSNSSASFYLQ